MDINTIKKTHISMVPTATVEYVITSHTGDAMKVKPYGVKKKSKKKKQGRLASNEKLLAILVSRGQKTFVKPNINREDLPNLTVRVPEYIRRNVHTTAKRLGMRADHLIEFLFVKAYASHSG
jgi:hypothetical protein